MNFYTSACDEFQLKWTFSLNSSTSLHINTYSCTWIEYLYKKHFIPTLKSNNHNFNLCLSNSIYARYTLFNKDFFFHIWKHTKYLIALARLYTCSIICMCCLCGAFVTRAHMSVNTYPTARHKMGRFYVHVIMYTACDVPCI